MKKKSPLTLRVTRAVAFALIVGITQIATAQSNLVKNASFEDTFLESDWYIGINGATVERFWGTPNGKAMVRFSPFIAQEIDTVTGRRYYLKVACQTDGVVVRFGNATVNSFTNVGGTNFYINVPWFYVSCHLTASSNRTWLRFESPVAFNIDDVLLGWLDEPLAITNQPRSVSAVLGGRAAFEVGAVGGPPITYQWFHNASPIVSATNRFLLLTNVGLSHAGSYSVAVSNPVSSAQSEVASLDAIDAPQSPQIVMHPESFALIANTEISLRVAAIGTPPLRYQWRLNGTNIAGATNSTLLLSPIRPEDAGEYFVIVENSRGSALSLPSTISVEALSGAAAIFIGNRFSAGTGSPASNPTYDVDGSTLLRGPEYQFQVYAGKSPESIVALGTPGIYRTNPAVYGYILQQTITFPFTDIRPPSTVFAQLRVWEAAYGSSYEEARASGGKVGVSPIVSAVALGPPIAPLYVAVPSFNLRAGSPFFTTGKIERGAKLAGGAYEWILTGAPGFTYVIERREPPHQWIPLVVLTNTTGTISFVDTNKQNASVNFYRSRMLD